MHNYTYYIRNLLLLKAPKNNLIKGTNLTHLCPPLRSTFAVREMASLGQQMLNATVGKNGLMLKEFPISVTHKGTHNTFNSQTFVFSIISQNYAFSIIFQNYVFLNSSHNHA